MGQLRQRWPDVRLILVGGSIYRDTRLHKNNKMAEDLALGDRVALARTKISGRSSSLHARVHFILPNRRKFRPWKRWPVGRWWQVAVEAQKTL